MKTKKINIPLSDQVVERKIAEELTNKLKGVGIEVIGDNYYDEYGDLLIKRYDDTSRMCYYNTRTGNTKSSRRLGEILSTYTLPELLAVLPDKIYFSNGMAIKNEKFYLMLDKECLRYYKVLENGKFDFITKSEWTIRKGTNLATAAAKLLIWCIDNGYMKGGGE